MGRCPVCNRRFHKRYDLALHLAMKRDKLHEDWRAVHDLPVGYETMKEAHKIASRIKKLLNDSQDK